MHSSLRTIDHMMIINDGMIGGGFTSYKNIFNIKHHFPKNESHTLEEIAKLTGYKKKGLQTIFNKGVGAYHTNPLSVRKQVKSPEQWAMGRVYASINPDSKAYQVDKSHLIKGGMIGGMAKVDKIDLSKTEIRKGNYYGYQPNNIDEEMEGNMFIRNAIENDTDDAYELRDALGLTDEEIIKKLNEEREALYKRYDTLGIEPLDQRIEEETESENEEEPESENEEEMENMGNEDIDVGADYTNEFGNRITLYNNKAYNEIDKEIRADKSVKNKASVVGETIENTLSEVEEYHSLFDKIFDNKIPQKVYNSSNLDNPEYTDIFKEYVKKENIKNKYLIDRKVIEPKQDYYLFDFFVGNNEACELKSLSSGYPTYVKDGFIPLTETKINGIGTQFKPHYKNINGENKLQQVKCIINDFGVKRTIDTLKNENIDYKILFFLKDGIYYYEPLKDENFIIKENGRGQLNYEKEKVDYGNDKVTYYYKIPPKKLIPVQKYTYNNIFK